MKGNIIVGQSGGPTAAINSSLAGVFSAAKELGVNKVYGMLHGVQGLLDEQYMDMSEHVKSDLDVETLRRTPAAFLGSCRYKLPTSQDAPEVYEKIFEVLDKLDVQLFIYIGGNDSMDTIAKLSVYAKEIGSTKQFMGAPKTIDNDLAVTDHTPGFGSAAKYIGTSMKEIVRDAQCIVFDKGLVTIVEIMGRNAGWLTGAAALAKGEDNAGADMIYLPELTFDMDDFMARVKKLLQEKHSVVVAVSEGIKLADGRYVCEQSNGVDFVDAFGHKQLSGTASYLAGAVAGELGCKTRAIEFSILQRAGSHMASATDLREAFESGKAAVYAAEEGKTGLMVLLERVSNTPYEFTTGLHDVTQIANDEKVVPREWITEDGTNVTDEFVEYVRPLIQGEVSPFIVDGLPRHLYHPYK